MCKRLHTGRREERFFLGGGVAGSNVWAWVLTIPCSAFIAAVAWGIGTLIL